MECTSKHATKDQEILFGLCNRFNHPKPCFLNTKDIRHNYDNFAKTKKNFSLEISFVLA